MGEGEQTDRQKKHGHRHINNMTWPGLGAGPSENRQQKADIGTPFQLIRHFRNWYLLLIGFQLNPISY